MRRRMNAPSRTASAQGGAYPGTFIYGRQGSTSPPGHIFRRRIAQGGASASGRTAARNITFELVSADDPSSLSLVWRDGYRDRNVTAQRTGLSRRTGIMLDGISKPRSMEEGGVSISGDRKGISGTVTSMGRFDGNQFTGEPWASRRPWLCCDHSRRRSRRAAADLELASAGSGPRQASEGTRTHDFKSLSSTWGMLTTSAV